jgi:HAD superfamily hydrolase (TIGR01549 family)
MKDQNIKHIWFDLGETINIHSPEFTKVYEDLRYGLYSEITDKPVDEDLKQEYLELYKKHGSNSVTFSALGKPVDFWQSHFSKIDKTQFYQPDERVYKTLERLKDIVPISLFSNIKSDEIIRTLNLIKLDRDWFTYIINSDNIANRKPHPEGFYKIIEVSKLPASKILYVGDRVNVDILPAKSVGLKTCLVWGKSAEADYSFENFADILTIVQ